MLPTFIISFREILEISIIITIILAATKNIPGRMLWICLGVMGGIVGSGVVAMFATNISSAVEGVGQELFNAVILFIAVVMIIWTAVWMQTHGRAIAQKFKEVGKAVIEGSVPLYSIGVVVGLAILREGSEIVLFMTGILSTSNDSQLSIALGAILGTLSAATIGVLLYLGLLKLSTKHLFKVSGWLLILLACGMSAQMASYLTAADLLPEFGQLWDSSQLLSQNSIVGKILHAMIGYSERPSGIQLIFYSITLLLTLILLKVTKSHVARKQIA